MVSEKVMKKSGFTLAEVLITLGIIGVVAALTVPTLMQNADERATVTALKKAYSTLSNAYKLAEQENGTPDNWGLVVGDSPSMLDKLKPYLRVDKDCSDGSRGCFPPGVTYKFLAPVRGNWGLFDDILNDKLKLVDGTLVMGAAYPNCNGVYGSTLALQNVCGEYYVDVNGFKKPNQLGRDFFPFFLTKYGIIPFGSAQETAWPTFATDCQNKDNGYGWGCTAWILYNDNMDYLHCNYIDWGGKTKCD